MGKWSSLGIQPSGMVPTSSNASRPSGASHLGISHRIARSCPRSAICKSLPFTLKLRNSSATGLPAFALLIWVHPPSRRDLSHSATASAGDIWLPRRPCESPFRMELPSAFRRPCTTSQAQVVRLKSGAGANGSKGGQAKASIRQPGQTSWTPTVAQSSFHRRSDGSCSTARIA